MSKTAMQEVYNARHKAETVNDFLTWLNDNYQLLMEKEKEQIINAHVAGSSDQNELPIDYYSKTYTPQL